jgi:hypothetical protein
VAELLGRSRWVPAQWLPQWQSPQLATMLAFRTVTRAYADGDAYACYPSLAEIRHSWKNDLFSRTFPRVTDGLPRVTDIADRTGITYVTHGKMIYFAHALMHSQDGAAVVAALR